LRRAFVLTWFALTHCRRARFGAPRRCGLPEAEDDDSTCVTLHVAQTLDGRIAAAGASERRGEGGVEKETLMYTSAMRRLRVENPCSASWEQMTGGERSRRCPACAQDVQNLSAMTELEATAVLLVFGAGGLCVRYEQDASGLIKHAEPKRRPALAPSRATSSLVAAALGIAACAPAAPVAPPPEAPAPARPIAPVAAVDPPAAAPSAPPSSRSELALPASDPAPLAISSPPADTDQDGILDPDDACPTISGRASAERHKNGCPQVVVVVQGGATQIETIRFSHGSRAISTSARPLIEVVAQILREHPEITRVAVEGHASIDEPNARKLGVARAKAVIDALVALKIEPDRLVVDAHGSDQPLADSATPTGRIANRRVQFKILERTSCPAPGAGGT
jgi:outer membrane protein OmpA-like peptidoglycan-associated protein